MSKLQFPQGFLWGSAVWALGVEGGATEDGRTLTVLEKQALLYPERLYNGVGPEKTLNWRYDYERFAQLAADLHHTSFRTSVQWSRLIPDGEHVSESAIEFYRNEFRAFKERGIELSVVLYWFDMPVYMEDRGGFTTRDIEDDFVRYCDTCFKLFDGLVDVWYVYNEPAVDVFTKYAWGTCYPNRLSWSDICCATYNMVVAHARVVETFRVGNYSGKIGTVMSHGHVYPRSDSGRDQLAAREDSVLIHGCYEDPMLAGRLCQDWLDIVERSGVVLDRRSGDEELIAANTISLLGMNIYMPERVYYDENGLSVAQWFGSMQGDSSVEAPAGEREDFHLHSRMYTDPNAKMNKDRGWEIYPQVVYDSLMDIERRYPGTETRITENGMGAQDEGRFRDASGVIQDDYRIEYLCDHIAWAHRAIEDGANLTCYNMWSFVDLWSPSNQFKNCYGLIEYDLETGETRRKKSADWFQALTDANALDA